MCLRFMTRYVPNAEESRCFQPLKIKEFEVDFEGKWDAVAKKVDIVDAVRNEEKHKHPGIFAMIAKISLGLRKFRNHRENFAILEKLGNFARLAKFR